MIRIRTIAVENLRGYEQTSLEVGSLTVLVGENNEGKSSILKMLDRLFQIPSSFWAGDRALTEQDFQFWYPANNARHRARRFSVSIELIDGRLSRRFGLPKGSLIHLRFAVSSAGVCRLNIGEPRKAEVHDQKAEDLLSALQEKMTLLFLPPVRDARSSVFAEKVTRDVKQQLRHRLEHSKQAGAPKEYRLAREAIDKVRQIVGLHRGELRRSQDSPLASMLRSSEVRLELFPMDVYALIEKSLFVYLSTGDHDALKVLPSEVGNGLQSLIDINLTLDDVIRNKNNRAVLAVIEEPEAFLHPSAQRQFMQFLRRALLDGLDAAILTTHSPVVVDEARYEEIVLVRNQRHYAPTELDRASINTSLMTTSSAEVFFARTVVLVEGEGDRAFLNALFRRIKSAAYVCPELAGLVFQITGGCKSYAPWLRLVRSYRRGGQEPFDCVWIMDGDAARKSDGQRPLLRAMADCGFSLTAEQTQAISTFGDLHWDAGIRAPGSADAANESICPHGGHLFSCDLEWAFFNNASNRTLQRLKAALKSADVTVLETDGPVDLARRLGSKIQNGQASGSNKRPYIRALIGEHLELSSLPPEIHRVVQRILRVCFKSESRFSEVVEACGIAMDLETN